MAVTIYNPAPGSPDSVDEVAAPIVEWRADWSDPWQYNPELLALRVTQSGGSALSQAEIEAPYGSLVYPWETAFADRDVYNLDNLWIRIRLVAATGTHTIFVGRIAGETREVLETGDESGAEERKPTGRQGWVAYGPLRMLQKIHVARSWWLKEDAEGDSAIELAHVPDMNARDAQQTLIGNRTAAKLDDSYLYGGTEIWSAYDYLEYLIDRFITIPGAGGPEWRITGGVDSLAALRTHLRFGPNATLASMLEELASPRNGLDFCIVPFAVEDDDGVETAGGFEVYIYELTTEDWAFNDATLPKNPLTVRIEAPLPTDTMQVRLVSDAGQRYSKIRVSGARLVVCMTLRVSDGTLVAKWSPVLEELYRAGAGDNGDYLSRDHDRVRQRPIFRDVYQSFGAPEDWDFNAGAAAPKLSLTGDLLEGEIADYQTVLRGLLPWLPLYEQTDYTQDPPLEYSPAGHTPDLLPPLALIWDPQRSSYMPIEYAGASVAVSRTDWSIWLNCPHNHLLALNHFAPLPGSEWQNEEQAPGPTPPEYDYETLIVTVALRTDQRLTLGFDVPGAPPDGSILEVDIPGAEFWYLAPGTVIGVNASGGLDTHAGDTGGGVILRNDADRLAQIMVGTMARYACNRNRATIARHGLHPWLPLLTHILTVVEQGGYEARVQSPITGIDWSIAPGSGDGAVPNPYTVLRTGFAR